MNILLRGLLSSFFKYHNVKMSLSLSLSVFMNNKIYQIRSTFQDNLHSRKEVASVIFIFC